MNVAQVKKIFIPLYIIFTVALGHEAQCSIEKNCECVFTSTYFEMRCPKLQPNVLITMDKTRNADVKCISDKWTNISANRKLKVNSLTLNECAEKNYIDELLKIFHVEMIRSVAFNGNASVDLKQIGDVSSKFTTTESLQISSYKVDKTVLSNANHLRSLLVKRSVVKLTSDFFNESSHLKDLDLSYNNIAFIPFSLFRPTQKIDTIDLSYNKLMLLLGKPFRSLRYLRKLNLEANKLRVVLEGMLENLVSLEELNLSRNVITKIEMDAFDIDVHYGKLSIVNLSYNNLAADEYIWGSRFSSIYRDPHHLQLLDLNHNNITLFLNEWMDHKCADILDLRYNEIDTIDLKRLQNMYSNGKMLNLNDDVNLYKSSGARERYNNTIFLKGNPVVLDKKLQHLNEYYSYVINKTSMDLNNLQCEGGTANVQSYTCSLHDKNESFVEFCPQHCTCKVRPWELVLVIDCSGRGLTSNPRLHVGHFYVEMHLENNRLTSGPLANDGYDNVTKLYLSGNSINNISWIPSKITVLEIHDNNITALNIDIIEELRSAVLLEYITLHKNPWTCTCSTFQLVELLKMFRPYRKVDSKQIVCENLKRKMMDLNYSDLCRAFTTFTRIVIICSVLTAMVTAIFASISYKYHEEIKIWLHTRNFPLISRREISDPNLNDAFICYTYKDEHFLLDDLLPMLEGGLIPYKISFHVRDWLAGEYKTIQMAKSIEESRRIIVILSSNFLRSTWGMVEFRMAHQKAMEERRIKIIVIVYEDVDVEEIPDKSLKKYITTKSCIRWRDKKFWTKLKNALPTQDTISYKLLLQNERTLTENVN